MKNKLNISLNLINGEEYSIPKEINDKTKIDNFLLNNAGKKVVVVQGLGFVGAVMSLVCANAKKEEYAVIGVDLPSPNTYWKIKSINNGTFPIVASDPKIEEYFSNSKTKNNFYATYDPYAYSKADIVIVDINLDVNKSSSSQGDLIDYNVDLNPFKKAIKTIGEHCKEDVLILVETTVPPGTCKQVVNQIIKKCFEQRGLSLNDFRLGHSYERVMPGPGYIDSIENFYRVYSGIDDKSANAVKSFLKTIITTNEYPLTRLGSTNATELAKVLENSYRATNIAFAIEWSRFAEESNVNLYEVVSAIRMRPTHSNLMFPGIGVGGYCLTKDPLLASWSRQNHFGSSEPLTQSENGVKLNDKMPLYAFEFFKNNFYKNKKRKVLLLGVSYRGDVGDTRYSPVEKFYKFLLNDGFNVSCHDPFIDKWEEMDIEINQDLNYHFNSNPDVIIISTGHTIYQSKETVDLIKKLDSIYIFDMIGHLSKSQIENLNKKHKVKVLGRGDL
jgi:UDP-N-acetyl-D-glucosamine dehydrogenase